MFVVCLLDYFNAASLACLFFCQCLFVQDCTRVLLHVETPNLCRIEAIYRVAEIPRIVTYCELATFMDRSEALRSDEDSFCFCYRHPTVHESTFNIAAGQFNNKPFVLVSSVANFDDNGNICWHQCVMCCKHLNVFQHASYFIRK